MKQQEGGGCLYVFSTLEAASAACRSVPHARRSVGDVYYLADEGYYLLLPEGGAEAERAFAPFREFGRSVPVRYSTFVREHGICVKRGCAVSLLARL